MPRGCGRKLHVKAVYKTNILEEDISEVPLAQAPAGHRCFKIALRPFDVSTYRLQLQALVVCCTALGRGSVEE